MPNTNIISQFVIFVNEYGKENVNFTAFFVKNIQRRVNSRIRPANCTFSVFLLFELYLPKFLLFHAIDAALQILCFRRGGQDGMVAALGAVFHLHKAGVTVLRGIQNHLLEGLRQHML